MTDLEVKAGGKANIEKYRMLEEDEIEQFIKTDVCGMFSISFFYQFRKKQPLTSGFIKVAPIIVVLVQMIAFTILVLYYYEEYDQGWCPQSTAPLYGRLTGSIISLYYVVHLWLSYCEANKNWVMYENLSNILENAHPDQSSYALALNGRLQVDTLFLYFIFDNVIYVVNLWLIGLTDSPLDMLLNSIALQFITQMDNEVKCRMLDLYPEIKEDIKYYFKHGECYKPNDNEPKVNEPTNTTNDSLSEPSAVKANKVLPSTPAIVVDNGAHEVLKEEFDHNQHVPLPHWLRACHEGLEKVIECILQCLIYIFGLVAILLFPVAVLIYGLLMAFYCLFLYVVLWPAFLLTYVAAFPIAVVCIFYSPICKPHGVL
jgi:hypothetical protein